MSVPPWGRASAGALRAPTTPERSREARNPAEKHSDTPRFPRVFAVRERIWGTDRRSGDVAGGRRRQPARPAAGGRGRPAALEERQEDADQRAHAEGEDDRADAHRAAQQPADQQRRALDEGAHDPDAPAG